MILGQIYYKIRIFFSDNNPVGFTQQKILEIITSKKKLAMKEFFLKRKTDCFFTQKSKFKKKVS